MDTLPLFATSIPDFGIPNLKQAAARKHGEFPKLQHRAFDPYFRPATKDADFVDS
jgi:hypothetical protein